MRFCSFNRCVWTSSGLSTFCFFAGTSEQHPLHSWPRPSLGRHSAHSCCLEPSTLLRNCKDSPPQPNAASHRTHRCGVAIHSHQPFHAPACTGAKPCEWTLRYSGSKWRGRTWRRICSPLHRLDCPKLEYESSNHNPWSCFSLMIARGKVMVGYVVKVSEVLVLFPRRPNSSFEAPRDHSFERIKSNAMGSSCVMA